ncbi:TIGR04283 family arsenosugar biosynthesis glycosyltransferase [Aliifodinibius sp. S!AR15-10]|uniref:TIGR04283 family arsenosugar biosynthesis glycosyltransferase n=1 Tax=Aliifodinibius sp. S!AR15-10 TaxID=2950437 RepID=UPI00285AD77C|nr:TIGR04283 family arsenosugar biosynthesis glycosyltransferase [Aliifodinibius sp. S!AR15-10]MDR8392671.1 TIGR04283 family arsenosugar biosynthesis glycosyltransferase [Aliifodinibius sp. S!AR15-10]
MRISVIIPALNEADVIGQTIRELKTRNGQHVHEIIVADGGSTDQTREIAETSGARVIETARKGRARQMNAGAEAASSELFYFLHADSIPPRGFDQTIMTALQDGYPAGCFRLAFDSKHPLLRFYAWCTRFDIDAFRFGDQSLFITRDLFKSVGGFNPKLIVMEDNVMVRCIKKEGGFYISPKKVITSARKYRENGVIRLQLIFVLIYTLFFLGVSQETLVSTYKKLINS